MLRYKTETRPGLVALYDIQPGHIFTNFSGRCHMDHGRNHQILAVIQTTLHYS